MRRLKLMLTLIALLVATGVWAQGVIGGGRQKPVITDYPATFAVDHGFYIYNVATDKFLSMGEAWGTQSCVVDFENDASGNKPFVYQFKNDVQENTTLPEGTYYLWSADVGKNRGWMARINTDGTSGNTSTCFSDGNAAHFSAFKTNWKVTDMGEGIYMITVPEDDPNGMYLDGCALGVDPEHYSNAATPTYAVYWDIEATNPGCQWMLFDADAFNADNEIYSVAAPALLELIEKARANGIDVTEALAVYNNDNATLEEINTQITALNELLIAYATPNNPVDVTDKYIVNATPTANSDGWTITGRATFDSNNNCAEFWNVSGASIKQTLFGLPAGSYKLSAVAFTRSDMTAALSANENTVNLVTVGSEVVNSRAQAASWFNEGNGLNELIFGLAESADVEIGLTADTNSGDHWMLWRNFKLEYLGNNGGEIIIPSDTIDIQPCTMMGSVMSADGEALAGTKVIVKNEEGMVVATTTVNANGYYIVEGLTEGIYVVEITYPGYVSVTMQFMAIAGESVSQNITLVKEPEIIQPCTIMGSVMSADGRALAGTKVIVKNEEGMVVATTTVNANGYYVVEDLPEGMYEVEITCPGYVSITMQLMAIAGEPVSQSIILVKESEIIIEGERQKPEIANYSVNIWETDHGYYIYNVGTDKFLSKGEAWGTQSCVVDFENDASGNKPFVYQFKNDVQENTTLPEGTYYLWSKDAGGKGWMSRINTDSKAGSTSTCFSDGNASHFSALKANWEITDMGGGIFQISVPVDDPNGMYLDGCALGVDPEHYSNAATPTYAVYWDIPVDNAGTQWMLFDADAFDAANEIYSVAAPELFALIQRAQEKGIDVTEAQTIYNNVNATLDEINEQIAILKEILEGYATAEAPADVTEKYIVNPAPYQNIDGWTAPKGMPNSLDAGNKCAEFWSYSGYSIEQTLTLPAGLYKLTAIALSREGHHGFLSAGDYKVELAHVANSVVNNRTQANTWFNEGNGVNELYFPMAEDGQITIALTADATTGDHWTVWRSFKLDYLGNDLEASYKDAIRMMIPEDWADEFAYDVTYTQSYFDAVGAAIASVDDIATVEDAIAELANPAPAVAIQTLRDNVAAWDAFSVWYDNMQTTFYSTPIADGLGSMGDYVGLYNDATDMEDWLLDIAAVWDGYAKALAPVAEEITTEMLTTGGTEWFDSLYRATVLDILSQEIVPHTDITASFIVNPDFYSDGGTLAGWTVLNGRYGNNGRSYSNPVWYNNFHRVMEKWNGDFNFYQDIVLPKTGVYRVSTWGFYRPSDNQTMGAANSAWAVWNAANGKNEGANTVCAFFYADQLQKAFPNICNRTYTRAEIDAIGADYDDEIAISRTSRGGYANEYPYDFLLVEGSQDDGIFIPNGVYSADYVFTHDPYQESYKIEFAFVGQEKQPLRLGIKAENVGVPAGDIGWTLFDQLQLIYEGADADILEEPLAALIDQAVALLDKSNSREIRKVLDAAIENGQNAIAVQDGDAMLAAYNQLNDAIAFATENMDNYEILIAAQDKLNEAIQTYGAKTFDATLAEATVLQRDIEAMLADGTDNLENILNKIDEVDSMVVKLMIPDFDKQAYPYDLTFAIKNPKFTEDLVNGRVPGWNYNEDADYAPLSVANGIAEGYVNAKKGFDIWQTISGLPDGRKLPAGIYEVHAQGIGRWSNNESNVEMGFASIDSSIRAEAYEQLKDQMPVMYANDVEGFIANPYELPESEDEKDLMAEDLGLDGWYTLTFDGIYDVNTGELREFFIPNNRSTLAERFAHGRYNEDGEIDAELTQKSPWYDNVLICNVGEDGALTLGWKLNNAASNAWAPMTNFRIFYIGPDEGYVPQYFAELAQAVAELQEMIDQEKGEEDVREAAAAYIAEINPGIENQTWTRDEAKVILARINEYKNQLSIISLAIHVDVPGTLGEIVLAEAGEYSNVKNIKVSGSLNEYDMECFREMSNIVTVDLFETDVTRIESDYFYRHESLTKAVLPKNLEYMGWGVFYDCYNLTNIVCPVAEPAYVDGEIMGGNEYQCTLTVPSISVAFYQKASYWSRFRIAGSNILPEDINVSHGTYTLNLPETIPATYKPNVWLGTTTIWGEHRYGGLEVNGNSTFSMNNFAITYDPNIDREYNSGWYERPNHQTVTYGTLVNNANMRADNVTVQMWTKTNEWTFFSVPFDVKVSSIRKEFGETPYVIRKYDGVKRAASDMDNTWVDMTADSTLVAGQGYILQSPSYNGRYYDGFSFDAIQNTNKNNIFANDNVDVQLAEYVSEFPQNRSWNLIGNPYPCFFDTRAIDVTAPVIVWNAYNSNYEAYSPVDDQLILKPGEAFFMQRPVDQASITFLKEGRQNNLVIRDVNYFGHARQSDMKEERNVFNLTLSDGERGDHTRFVINNSAKMSYEEGCDASKFMSLDWKANQLYTIQSGVRYAINERPMDNGVIELGLMIGTEGMLTIALETNVKNEVFLIDRQNNTEVRIDGTTGYEFFAEVGTIEGRFAIRLGDGSVTGINSVFGSDKDNNDYYDLRGVRIQQPRKGLYIQNGKKVVIK